MRPNQDGIHIGGYCEDGVIRNINAVGRSTTNDDLIALNADDVNTRAMNLDKINGPIKRIRIENISADDSHTFIRLLSIFSPLQDIEINCIKGGCQQMVLNLDAARYTNVPIIPKDDKRFYKPLGKIKNIKISDVDVYKTSLSNSPLLCIETKVANFEMHNFKRNIINDTNQKAPTLGLKYLPPSILELIGINKYQINSFINEIDDKELQIMKIASPYLDPDYKIKYTLDNNSIIKFIQGGFKKLFIEQIKQKRI